MNEFEMELAAEMAEENIISDCGTCMGTGIVTVRDAFGEYAEECKCLKNYTSNF